MHYWFCQIELIESIWQKKTGLKESSTIEFSLNTQYNNSKLGNFILAAQFKISKTNEVHKLNM